MGSEILVQLERIFVREENSRCKNLRGWTDRFDEGGVVDEGEEGHLQLTIHPICHTSVAWYDAVEVLDLVCALDRRGKESPEWPHNGSKEPKGEAVDLNGQYLEGPALR